jgi:hypothetical protein
MSEEIVDKLDNIDVLYRFLENEILKYKYLHKPAIIIRQFRDKMRKEKRTEEEQKAQIELDVMNSIITNKAEIKPYIAQVNQKGEVLRYLELTDLDATFYDYLDQRLEQTNNPRLKSRYSHFLWSGPRKHTKYARIAIETYILLVKYYESKKRQHEDDNNSIHVIRFMMNAYYIARQSETNLEIVKTEIKRLILEPISDLDFSFVICTNLAELMLEEKRIFIKEDFNGINKICFKLAEEKKKQKYIQAAIRLYELGERIESRLGKKGYNWRQLIAESYETLMTFIQGKPNILSATWCQKALENFRVIKDKKKIAELEKKYDEIKNLVEFKEVNVKVDFTDEIKQSRELAEKLMKKDSEEIIRILVHDNSLLPTCKEVKGAAEKDSTEIPLITLFPTEIVDQSGHIAQYFTTEEEKKYYRILHNYDISLRYGKTILVDAIFWEAIKTRKLNPQDLFDFFKKYCWFGKTLTKKISENRIFKFNWLSLIMPSIYEYFYQMECSLMTGIEPNLVLVIDSLTLKIEGLIRELCRATGDTPFYQVKDEKGRAIIREKDIHRLLYEQQMKKLFNEDDLLFFRFLFVEKAGSNLRHKVAHSLMFLDDYSVSITNLLLMALLKLGRYDFGKKTNHSTQKIPK